jgi:YD repeat-containing protein
MPPHRPLTIILVLVSLLTIIDSAESHFRGPGSSLTVQGSYTLTATPSQVAPGGQLSVSWTAPSGRPSTDWIALYKVEDPNTSYGSWQYTQGATSGSFTVTTPSSANKYEFRYLLQNGYTVATYSNTVPITVAPSVSITAPSNNASFVTPASVTINASASDSDGTVSKVEFFQGNTKLGETTTSPYSYTWNNPAVASYALTAKATDNLGAVTTSGAINITVSLPTGAISGKVTRLDGTTAIAGATIKVYQGTTLNGTASTNSTGDYTVGVLNTGSYLVEASAAGYETKTQTAVSVTNGATTTLNLSLAVPVNYVYDELGRLVSVIDKDGNAATYSYDAVGNLLSISRQVPTVVSIIRFSPNGGAVGTPVTVYGSGFSATASQNTVTFNGVSATVTASSTNLFVTSVPTGATTGTIAVTAPAGSATSSASFSVGSSSPGAPTVTSFTPTVGAAGTSVTITGTNFDTTVANDKASFNVSQALLGSVTSTSIATTLPTATASGRVSVTTPMGKAVSSADFIVPPYPYAASDIEYTGRMSIGGTNTVTITTVNKVGLMLFDGTANQRVSLSYTNNTISLGVVKVFDPTGAEMLSFGSVLQSSGFAEPMRLPTTGTYTIMVDPETTGVGSIPMTLYDVPPDTTGSITIGGSAVSVTTTVPGQNASLSFSANAGQKVSLNVSGSTISLGDIYIKDRWGANLGSLLFGTGTGFMDTVTLPSTGSYSISVNPRTTNTGSAMLTLNNTNDITGTITPGGSSVSISTSIPGQNAVLTFSGTNGQRVSLLGTNNSLTFLAIGIYKPDGGVLTSISGYLGSSPFIDVQTLPTTGTYSIVVNPENTQTGGITLTLYNVPADASGSITIGGAAASVTITTPGQNGALTFSGTASQQATVHITTNTMGSVTVTLLKPDGSTLTSATSSSSSFDLSTQTLPTTGTYTIRIDPGGTNTGAMNVSVTSP